MTTSRQFADSEGDFRGWQDHPQACNRLVPSESTPGTRRLCGAKVQVRQWDSHDGAYEDFQYRCANGHTWWIDGIDA